MTILLYSTLLERPQSDRRYGVFLVRISFFELYKLTGTRFIHLLSYYVQQAFTLAVFCTGWLRGFESS